MNASFKNMLDNPATFDATVSAAKVHCSFLVNGRRYSISKSISGEGVKDKILEVFQKLIETPEVQNVVEFHWDLFLKSSDNTFIWYRKENGDPKSDAFRSDQKFRDASQTPIPGVHRSGHSEEKTSSWEKRGPFLDFYTRTGKDLSSLFKGRYVIEVLDEQGNFINNEELTVKAVAPPTIKSVAFD